MLASWRPCHHPISKKDIIPTPSQPMKSWYMLFAVMITSIVIKNVSRYLMNLLMFGSVAMYHIENSVIDHVMNRAIGVNSSDVVSRVMEMLIFSVGEIISGMRDSVSSLLFNSWLIGIRLIRKSIMRLFLVLLCGCIMDIVKDSIIVRMIVGVIKFISTTWICTKDFGA